MVAVKYLAVQPPGLAHCLERVIDFGKRDPGVVAHHGHAAKYYVERFALKPKVEKRRQLVAIWARVEEKIDHFHALAGFDRLLGNQTVIDVALRLLRCGRQRDKDERQPAQSKPAVDFCAREHRLFAFVFLARLRDQLVEHLEKALIINAIVTVKRH